MELISLEWVLEKAFIWLNAASHKEKAAMETFLDALNETQIYLGSLQKSKENANRDEEKRLSKIWNEAAKAARPFDDDLYRRCLAKACHWSGSSKFMDSEIATVNTSIKGLLEIALKKKKTLLGTGKDA